MAAIRYGLSGNVSPPELKRGRIHAGFHSQCAARVDQRAWPHVPLSWRVTKRASYDYYTQVRLADKAGRSGWDDLQTACGLFGLV